jgi:hypothetical protein
MKNKLLGMSCVAALLLIPGAFAEHTLGLTAKITLPDGTIRMARIEGLGCSASICSRVAIKGKAGGDSLTTIQLDSIAAIRDTTEKDALLVMKNGTEQRVALVKDFRVLYLGSPEKLDLGKIRSLEFLPSTK